jgi:putative tricarboxylic transport membrane protein
MKRYQIGSAIFLLVFGIIISFEARKLEIGRISQPGPGFFPLWLGLALIIVSLALTIKFSREKVDQSSPSKSLWKGLYWEKIVFSLVVLLLYAFFLEILGYTIATFLLMLFLFKAIGSQRWRVSIVGSVFTSLSTYALFKLWLQVQLPVGLWGM